MENKYINLIKELSDPNLRGRAPGSGGHKAAKELIIQQFEELKLEPLMEQEWGQRFFVSEEITGENLLAWKKGSSREWILLGAHYDHFKNIPGADDNAASIGIVFDAIASLAQIPHNLTIVLGIFDLEEPPYFLSEKMGSVYFYNHLPEALDMELFKGAIVLDICGHDIAIKGREQSLFAVGADSSPLLSTSIEEAAQMNDNLLIYQILGRARLHLSDHYIFDIHGQPHIFLTCGHWPYYHTPQDTFERLNLEKVAQVAEFLREVIVRIEANLAKEAAGLKKFTKEDEWREVSRLVDMEMPAGQSIDPILGVLMHIIARKRKTSLRKVQLMLKILLKSL